MELLPHQSISREVKAILLDADRNIQQLAFGKHHLLYEYIRLVMAKITTVDSFYVGYYCEGKKMIFPYASDGENYDDPEPVPYSEDGLSVWMLKHKRFYCYRHDNGLLLLKGRRFGDTSRISEDGVAVPLLERSGKRPPRVAGIMAILSYTRDIYDDTVAEALQWLANSMMTALRRRRDDHMRRIELAGEDPIDQLHPRSMGAVVEDMGAILVSIRDKVDQLRPLIPDGHRDLESAVDNLRHECEASQTELVEQMLEIVLGPTSVLPSLTSRQRDVLELLVKDLTDKEIANRLSIEITTVKSHVSALISAFGTKGRTGIIEKFKYLV
jgi:DNA-binding CsgD family transcriptional regulator